MTADRTTLLAPLQWPSTKTTTREVSNFSVLLACAGMAATLLAAACGDGPTEPEPPPEPPRATTVAVTPQTAELTALGASVQLSAQVLDQNGQTMAGAAVTWASGSATIATVSATGLVRAVQNGSVTITATSGSASGNAAVTVAQAAATVTVTPTADTLAPGDTLRLSAAGTDANGNAVAGAEFAWTSSAAAVARVDSSGLVTAVAAGSATIMAAAGDASATSEITVVPNRAPVVTDSVPRRTVLAGHSVTLSVAAVFSDPDGHALTHTATSSSTSLTDVSVSGTDVTITGVSVGTANITVTANDQYGLSASTSFEATVTNDHGDSFETATFVSLGDTVPGRITRGDEDYFKFRVPTDGFRLSAYTLGRTDTGGTLYDRNGSSITSDDYSGESLNFHIVRTLDAGTYYLKVRAGFLLGDTGSYFLVLGEAGAPDLIFTHISPRSQSVARGDTARVTITVRNSGTGRSTATKLGFYISADPTITRSDDRIGQVDFPSIGAGREITVEPWFVLASTAPTGTVYWGFCIDAVDGESDTTNNCSASSRLTITAASSQSSANAASAVSAEALIRFLANQTPPQILALTIETGTGPSPRTTKSTHVPWLNHLKENNR